LALNKKKFNVEECGLLFQTMANVTLEMKGEKCKNRRNSKERITLSLTTSVTSKKLQPSMIGKANKPRCFINGNVNSLSVTWKLNKAAWIISEKFTEWTNIVN
jgi:hypothetical protein